jgi:hypothetical protein
LVSAQVGEQKAEGILRVARHSRQKEKDGVGSEAAGVEEEEEMQESPEAQVWDSEWWFCRGC